MKKKFSTSQLKTFRRTFKFADSTHKNPIHSIIPPYILEAIVRNGTPRQRKIAKQSLAETEVFRAIRISKPESRTLPFTSVTSPHKNRLVYNTSNSAKLPGTLVRNEGQQPLKDVVVNEAYDGLGATFDLFWDIFHRNSIDNAGMDLIATVHYRNKYDNAFWNGNQMVFGDGDGSIFNRFTIAIDVIGHELTHGVTGETAGLEYMNQPGALNESVSDVFGSMVKQYSQNPKQTSAQADWLIGAGLLTPDIKGIALRSMKAPGTAYDDPVLGGKDPQPAHMDNYDKTNSDNGGVHINSGIPNHAFYLAAIALGGYSWEKAGRIWYETLIDSRLSSTAQFSDFASLTVVNASRIFGDAERDTVLNAWQQVGISVSSNLKSK